MDRRVTLAYSDVGEGSAIVLLHAFPLSRALWDAVVPDIAADGWRVITPDLPGFGESHTPVASIDAMADAVAALLDRCGIQTAVVGGCSMGGYVALALAERYPQRVAGLILADTKASADDEDTRKHRERIAEQVESSGSTRALSVTMPETLLGATTRAQRPQLVDWVTSQILANSAAGVAAAQRAMSGRRAQFETLASLRIPVLCIRGTEDLPSTTADHVAMSEAARDSVNIEVPDAGHLLPIEQPRAFIAHLQPFLTRVRGPHC